MTQRAAGFVLLGMWIGMMVSDLPAQAPAQPAKGELTAVQVREAINKAVKYLKQQQTKNGSWSDWVGQPGGVTALCTLALLEAGLEPEDPDLQRALAWLRKHRFQTTYAVSLQTMVFCKAQPSRDPLLIHQNVKWLEGKQIISGQRKGAWGYPGMKGDNSNSQFALLGLHEAQRVGVEVSDRTWRLAKAYWEDCQNADGSWGYYKGLSGTGSMTCAGIASLVITSDKVRPSDAEAIGDKIRCCGKSASDDGRLQRALQWLGRNFRVSGNPGAARPGIWMLYYLYGVERTGRLTAARFIGGHDWYREGADFLVHKQDALSGFWLGEFHAEQRDPRIATSLALLFLSKGRRPVLLGKLKHGADADWNRHRSDVDNLTRYVETRWKRDLTWQIVDLQAARVEDLLQSPVLYYCGKSSPLPQAAATRQRLAGKLRDYLDRGGFLFAEGYCGGSDFDRGFRRLIEEMFPEPEYQLRLLEPEHPIWRAEAAVNPNHLRPLWGLEFGCRTSIIYAPFDPPRPSLSCLWELSRSGRGKKSSPAVQAQIDAARTIGINVLAYATNRELKGKEDGFRTQPDLLPQSDQRRGVLRIASLRHQGGCNAAPRALINLVATAAGELKIRVSTQKIELSITDEAIFDFHLLFMHGRHSFRLSDAEQRQLAVYVRRGGMLFVNSICASRAFSQSFRREMAAIFPEHQLERIPTADPLLTRAWGGFDLATVTRRDPQGQPGKGPWKAMLRKVPPLLEGIKFDDRWGVVFSPYDLSCALEKHDSLECQGYVREDAARIGLNVILYSLQH